MDCDRWRRFGTSDILSHEISTVEAHMFLGSPFPTWIRWSRDLFKHINLGRPLLESVVLVCCCKRMPYHAAAMAAL
jgi:hypothetical protein